jgi:Zn-finger nucleic acid-binding protein
MRRIERTGVAIDLCAACGAVWLDGGELALLLANSASRAATLPPQAAGTGAIESWEEELLEWAEELFDTRRREEPGDSGGSIDLDFDLD